MHIINQHRRDAAAVPMIALGMLGLTPALAVATALALAWYALT